MRQKSIYGMIVLATALVLGPACRQSWSADRTPSDRLLPPNVYAYVTIPNFPELKTRWKQTLFGKLRDEKALAEFWKDVDKQIAKVSEEVEKNAGVKLDDLFALPAGELSIAILQPPGKSIGLVALLDYGKNEATIDKLLESGAKAAEAHGAKKSEKEINGTKVVLYSAPKEKGNDSENDKDKSKDEKKDAGKTEEAGHQMAYFLRDSCFVVGSDVSVIEAVLARWDGKHSQTFAENKAYAYISEKSRTGNSPPVLTWYLNPIDLLRAGLAANPEAAQGAGMVLGLLPQLGVTNFKAVGGGMDLATEEFDSISRTILYIDQPTSGILNMFQFPAAAQAPPNWVTEDASSYFAFNWNVSGAYDAVEALIDTFQGPGATAAMIDGLAGQEGGPKVHLKKDLIDQITGQMHVTSDTPHTEDPGKQRYLFAIDVKDAAKMKSVLESVAKTQGFPGEAREFHGQTIYEMELPPPAGDGKTKLGICVANNHLLIASDVTRIDQIILADKDRKPLADSADYKKIAKLFPAKTSMLSFTRQDVQMRALYDMLRSGTLGERVEGIDFSKLPAFEAIQKYLQASGSYAVPDKNGALFVNFSLKAEK